MTDEIRNLTGLRAYAALWVVLAHMQHWFSSEEKPYHFLFKGGGAGVIIFFVLSGFILAHRHGDRFRSRVTLREYVYFIWLRFARIYPVHLCVLLIMAARISPMTLAADTSIRSFIANVTLTQTWGIVPGFSFNPAAWTISAEWFAYLLFPLLIWFAARLKTPALILIGIAVAGLCPAVFGLGFKFGGLALFCLLAVAIGVFAYTLCRKADGHWTIWTAPAILLGPLLVLSLKEPPAHSLEIFVIGTAFFVAALFKSGPLFVYSNPLAVYLGKTSYSLYMVHVPTIWTFEKIYAAAHPLLILATCFGLASILYHLFEEPSRRLLQRHNPAAASSPAWRRTPTS